MSYFTKKLFFALFYYVIHLTLQNDEKKNFNPHFNSIHELTFKEIKQE